MIFKGTATRGTLFCRGSILLTIYAYKRGGVVERWHDDKGEGGSQYPLKVMTSFMNSPLKVTAYFTEKKIKFQTQTFFLRRGHLFKRFNLLQKD